MEGERDEAARKEMEARGKGRERGRGDFVILINYYIII